MTKGFSPYVLNKIRRHEREEMLRIGKGDRFRSLTRKRKASMPAQSYGQHSNNVAVEEGGDSASGGRREEATVGSDSSEVISKRGWHFEPRMMSSYEDNVASFRGRPVMKWS